MQPTETPGSDSDAFDNSAFDCPRCGVTTGDEYYGPCATCRDQLRAFQVREASDVQAAEYEPKMNVTPNAVALKD